MTARKIDNVNVARARIKWFVGSVTSGSVQLTPWKSPSHAHWYSLAIVAREEINEDVHHQLNSNLNKSHLVRMDRPIGKVTAHNVVHSIPDYNHTEHPRAH